MIDFQLDDLSGVATYLQLAQQVRHALRLGLLRPGDKLPTAMEVVAKLAINPNTVLKAYRELEREGLVRAQPGLGTFVLKSLSDHDPAEQAELRQQLAHWVFTARRAVALGKRPKLLLLDEPVADLDPLARRDFLKVLMEEVADSGMTVVVSSHQLAHVERTCEHLVLLAASRVQLADSTDVLLSHHRMVTGPRTAAAALEAAHDVVQAEYTERQASLLVVLDDRSPIRCGRCGRSRWNNSPWPTCPRPQPTRGRPRQPLRRFPHKPAHFAVGPALRPGLRRPTCRGRALCGADPARDEHRPRHAVSAISCGGGGVGRLRRRSRRRRGRR